MERDPQDIRKLFERIREKKKRNGIKYRVADFCRDIYINRQTYYNYIRKERKPSERVWALVDALEDREL